MGKKTAHALAIMAVTLLCNCGKTDNGSTQSSPAKAPVAPATTPPGKTPPATPPATTPATTPPVTTAPGAATTPPAPAMCPVATAVCGPSPGALDAEPGQCPECLSCEKTKSLTVAGCAETVGTSEPCQSHCHLPDNTPVNYCNDPPTSGDHSLSPEHKCGEHTEVVPRGSYVHSMEHGAVILVYNCPNGCQTELATLRKVMQARVGHKVIMTSDPMMKSARFAAASWTWLYTFATPDEASLLCFIDQHENFGREDIPLCQ